MKKNIKKFFLSLTKKISFFVVLLCLLFLNFLIVKPYGFVGNYFAEQELETIAYSYELKFDYFNRFTFGILSENKEDITDFIEYNGTWQFKTATDENSGLHTYTVDCRYFDSLNSRSMQLQFYYLNHTLSPYRGNIFKVIFVRK